MGPIFGPKFGPELWLPKDGLPKDWWGQMVGPALSSPLRFFGRGWQGFWQENSLVGEVGGRRGWRKWAGQRLGGRKVRGGRGRWSRPTPYAGPPPPLLKARVEGRLAPLARARGGARHWRHLLSRALRGRAVPQRKKALGAHGPEPRA